MDWDYHWLEAYHQQSCSKFTKLELLSQKFWLNLDPGVQNDFKGIPVWVFSSISSNAFDAEVPQEPSGREVLDSCGPQVMVLEFAVKIGNVKHHVQEAYATRWTPLTIAVKTNRAWFLVLLEEIRTSAVGELLGSLRPFWVSILVSSWYQVNLALGASKLILQVPC